MTEIFNNAKRVFKEYREKFLKDEILKEEFLDAIRNLLSLYNTRIYENRFIVGGIIEFIVLASFKGLNFNAKHIGKENERFDIEVIHNSTSVKYIYKIRYKINKCFRRER